MDATLINEFKKELRRDIRVFLKLRIMYEHDDESVYQKLPIYKKYLEMINKKYPEVELVVDEQDFTTDDIKILLNNFYY